MWVRRSGRGSGRPGGPGGALINPRRGATRKKEANDRLISAPRRRALAAAPPPRHPARGRPGPLACLHAGAGGSAGLGGLQPHSPQTRVRRLQLDLQAIFINRSANQKKKECFMKLSIAHTVLWQGKFITYQKSINFIVTTERVNFAVGVKLKIS